MLTRILRFFSLCLFICNGVYANQASFKRNVESMLKAEHVPAMSLTLIDTQSGKQSQYAFYGAPTTGSARITSASLFQVGSLTKTFTAFLVEKAIQAGKLQRNDRVGQYLPQYKRFSNVTIAQLLQQNSGITDYITTPHFFARLTPRRQFTASQLMSMANSLPARFSPGEGWGYSNSNYVILGCVLEKVYHQPFAALVSELLSQKHVANTYYLTHPYPATILQRMVRGYYQRIDSTDINGSWLQSAGALVSTPTSIARWYATLFNVHTGKPYFSYPFYSTKTGKVSSQLSPAGYQMGVFRINTPSGMLYFTPGLTSGYVSLAFYSPCLGVVGAYTFNKEPAHLHVKLLHRILALYSQQGRHVPAVCQTLPRSQQIVFPPIN